MKTKLSALLTILVLLALVFPPGSIPVIAQTEAPPGEPPAPEEGSEYDPNHLAERILDAHPVPGGWENLGLASAKPGFPLQPQLSGPFAAKGLSAGLSSTCAVSSDGAVKCWGDNSRGKLGNGSVVNSFTPVDVYGLSGGVTTISSTHKHTCALTSAGGVKCWGFNAHGELGNGTTIDSLVPVDVIGLTSGVVAISAGGFHTCALLNTGGVKCWGSNWHGEVGDSSTNERHTPVDVTGLTASVAAIQAGKWHTCALLFNGSMRCWGYNKYGQIGVGTNTDVHRPVEVPGLNSKVVKIAAGGMHTCAVMEDGSVRCWGENSGGQLGDGTRHDSWTPIVVAGLGGIADISTGYLFTCALTAEGTVKCWGDNWAGQVGNGTNVRQTSPVDVIGLPGKILSVETGDSHACAVNTAGLVFCWGSNSFGQVGDGTSDLRLEPVDVHGLSSNVAALAAGSLHTCALTTAGGVKCWGNNDYGQLGDGTNIDRITPVNVSGLSKDVVAIAAGGFHTCAVMKNGTVMCWGYNRYGELGDNSNNERRTPVLVNGLNSLALVVTAGFYHTCALMSSGGVACWGENGKGQLGNGTFSDTWRAVAVKGSVNWQTKAIAAGERHTCALTGAGAVKCWGYNFDGQLGNGTLTNSNRAVDVSGLSGVTGIATGVYHSCALVSNSGVKCWGGNYTGQLGDGTLDTRLVPASVSGLSGAITRLAAGGFHTCVLKDTGGVMCWGDNTGGQLGDGSTMLSAVPVNVQKLSDAVALTAGDYLTCVRTSTSAARCWGINDYGELGDGTVPWRITPGMVIGLQPAALTINATSGQPGSYFLINGAFFFPNTPVQVSVNNHAITETLQTDGAGSLAFSLKTTNANLGHYVVVVTAGLTAHVGFDLEASAPLVPRQGTAPVLDVPAKIAYLYNTYLPASMIPLLATH